VTRTLRTEFGAFRHHLRTRLRADSAKGFVETSLASALRTHERRVEFVGVALVLFLLFCLAVAVISMGKVFGHDEALYASKTRSFATSIPAASWSIFRPPGLPVLGLAAIPIGLDDVGLRSLGAGFGILASALAWSLARMLWGTLAAALALLAIVSSPIVLEQIVLFHNEMPSLAAVLALLCLLWWQLEVRERSNWLLLAAAPLAVVAFSVRYGVLAVLIGIGMAGLLLWSRRALRDIRLVGATISLLAILFGVHVVDAVAQTGSPLGIVSLAVSRTDTTTPDISLLQYVRALPLSLAGIGGIGLAIGALMAVIVAAADSARARRVSPSARPLTLLLVPAVVAAIGTIVVSHPEPRYLLVPLILVEIAGAGALARAARWTQAQLRSGNARLASRVVPGLLVGLVVLGAVMWARSFRGGTIPSRFQWIADSGRAIAARADPDCAVISTIGPQLSWYSRCEAMDFEDRDAATAQATGGGSVYVVLTSLDATRGHPDVISDFRRSVVLEEIDSIGTSDNGATVYRLAP
jgi:hypothetical protein